MTPKWTKRRPEAVSFMEHDMNVCPSHELAIAWKHVWHTSRINLDKKANAESDVTTGL